MRLSRRQALRTAAGFFAVSASACASVVPKSTLAGDEPKAHLRQGRLIGAPVGDGVAVFKGVPYAAAPIGPLRFRPPEAAPSWNGERAATEFGPIATQNAAADSTVSMSEDCLFLNVWAPTGGGPHPVLVFIHGGANAAGSTTSPTFDGAAFARAGVVCVTVGYRVGTWGFLELGEALGPEYAGSGVNGLRDQIAALAWVQGNIADFGGDPDRVTLGGHSAGAKNVCALLSSPAAAGLFSSAISMSGGGHTVHSRDDAAAVAELFFRGSAFEGASPSAIVDMPAEELLAAQREMMAAYPRNAPFRPAVENDVLPGRPVDAIAAGAGRDVRLLIGSARDESAVYLAGRTGETPIEAVELSNAWVFDAEPVYADYLKAYPGEPALRRRVRFMTAEEYWVPTMRVVEGRQRTADAAETYVYRFDWAPYAGALAGWAHHGADQTFVWGTIPTEQNERVPADAAVRDLNAMWASFIAGRAPNGSAWPAYAGADPQLLRVWETSELAPPDAMELGLWTGRL